MHRTNTQLVTPKMCMKSAQRQLVNVTLLHPDDMHCRAIKNQTCSTC
jgi:hypothetical protein